MFLAAGTVWIIERRFRIAGIWFATASVFAALGLVHGYRIDPTDIVSVLVPATQWALGYALLAGLCFAVPLISDYRESSSMSSAEREAVDLPEPALNGTSVSFPQTESTEQPSPATFPRS